MDTYFMEPLRPFSNLLYPKLKEVAAATWDDPETLAKVHAELGFRKRKRSHELREAINQRLLELSRESFKWPETAKMPASMALRGDHFYFQEGVLAFMGYHVGSKGIPKNKRIQILDYLFHEKAPRVNSSDHMEEWGAPKTARRLKKLADCLASFCRLAQGHQYADMQAPCEEWETDLEYLRKTYYVGRYDFSWPRG